MLRVFDKENFQPTPPDHKQSGKIKSPMVYDTRQIPQKELSSQVTSEQINLQVFEKQLKKLSDCYENQRKENWNITQAKNRLQNQVKVLHHEKENLLSENEKLRSQLTNLIFKMKELQTKNNSQLTDFYNLKNENNTLHIQLKRYQDCQKVWSQKWQQLANINIQLENESNRLQGQRMAWENECRLRDTEIQLLQRSITELEMENKKSLVSSQSDSWVSDQKFNQIGKQLENWKHAFEKKQQELETKLAVLQEQNNMMRKNLAQLSTQTVVKHSLQRSCSLPSETPDKFNEYQVRLFVKQNQIQKLTEKIKQLEEKTETLELENALLSKKCTEGTIFSPAGYQRYTQVQNAILKRSQLSKETTDLELQLEAKEKEIECLIEKLNETRKQMESVTLQIKQLEAEIGYERITHQNVVGELKSSKTKLQKELEVLKQKLVVARKQCVEKDKIIMNYIGKSTN